MTGLCAIKPKFARTLRVFKPKFARTVPVFKLKFARTLRANKTFLAEISVYTGFISFCRNTLNFYTTNFQTLGNIPDSIQIFFYTVCKFTAMLRIFKACELDNTLLACFHFLNCC